MLPEDFFDNQCQEYIQVDANSILSGALDKLQSKKGNLDWTLVVRRRDGFVAAYFSEILRWERSQPDRQAARLSSISNPDLPLLPAATAEDTSTLEELIASASQNPSGFVVILWAGTEMVCGTASLDQLEALQEGIGPPAPASKPIVTGAPVPGSPAEDGTHVEPALTVPSQPAGEMDSENTTAERVPPISGERVSIGDRVDQFEGRVRGVFQKYRLNILVAIVTFLVAIFSLLWTVRSDILPIFFPPKMTGLWNVAVARFDVQGEENISRAQANLMSDIFYGSFKDEMDELSKETGISIEVLNPEATGVIKGKSADERAANAGAKASKLNAHIIIYGTVTRQGQIIKFLPEFYLDQSNLYEVEELVGQHTLGDPITIQSTGQENLSQLNLNRELGRRSEVLALVTRGLSLYLGQAYDDALELFKEANQDKYWKSSTGREVLYLFAGNAASKSNLQDEAEEAYRSAIEINDGYGRGYVGLGHVYFQYSLPETVQEFQPDPENLDLALEYFNQALNAAHQPETADIPTKAAFGKGQVYLVQHYMGQNTLSKAVEEFKYVIGQFESEENRRLKELASESYGRLGLIARENGDLETAVEYYTTARKLSSHHFRRGFYSLTLGDIFALQGIMDEAAKLYQSAVDDYKAALDFAIQPDLRAEYFEELSKAYERLGDIEAAIKAMREAINILPTGSLKRDIFENRLDELERGRHAPGMISTP